MNNLIIMIKNNLINNQETISIKSLLEICNIYSIYNTKEIIDNFKSLNLINENDILYLPTCLQLEFIKRKNDGDNKAREVMILTNYNLVTNIVNHFVVKKIDKEDFVQYGLLGLIYALDNYEINKNLAFTTYATKCITGYLYNYLPKHINIMSISKYIFYLNKKIKKIEENLMKYLQKNYITDLEILNELKKSDQYSSITEEDIRHIRLYTLSTYSLNKETIKEDGRDADLIIDFISSETEEFENDVINNIYYETITKIFTDEIETKLNPRELKLLWYRFGFDNGIYKTTDEVGKILGISGSRTRQIEGTALRKLRKLNILQYKDKETKSYNHF